ncbi:MAG: ATP-dependent DNA ligase, partial [Thermoleophilia bacterium]|nr:ATP-dependent DNA ligase [Thermoleophilia bacterium]
MTDLARLWPFAPPRFPMEAKVSDALPEPPGWVYEPKWDGFRMLAWSGPDVRLDSRNGKPLLRYFPELASALRDLPGGTVVDGEVVVVREGRLDFDALQNRIHPAESRVRMLAEETPALLVAFDLLAVQGTDVRAHAFRDRRLLLVALAEGFGSPWHLTPSTENVEVGRRWFHEFESAGCDGIVAKALDRPYLEGERAMIKVKHRRSVDAVVGGFRLHKDGGKVGSVLLGLYNSEGELHFIGHLSGFSDADATALLPRLRALEAPEGFGRHARRPGAQSRWTGDKDLDWVPLRPELVLQVSYDQLTGDRFR